MSSEVFSHCLGPESPSFSRLPANEKAVLGKNDINQAVTHLAGSHSDDAPDQDDLHSRLISFDSEGYPCPALFYTTQYVARLLAGKISIQRHFALPTFGFPNHLYLKAGQNGTGNPLWKTENHSEYLGISQFLLHSAILSRNPAIKLVDGMDVNQPDFGILSFEKFVRQKLIKLKKHYDSERKFSLSALSERDIAIIGVFAAMGRNELYWRPRACAALEHPKLARANAKYFMMQFGNVVLDELDAIDVARGFVEKRYLYKDFGSYPFNTNAYRLQGTKRTEWPYTSLDKAITSASEMEQASNSQPNAKRVRNRGVAWKAFSTTRHRYGLDLIRSRSKNPIVGTLGAMFGDALGDFLDLAYRPDALVVTSGPEKKKGGSNDMTPDPKNSQKTGDPVATAGDLSPVYEDEQSIDLDDNHTLPNSPDLHGATNEGEPDIGDTHGNEAENEKIDSPGEDTAQGWYSMPKQEITCDNRPQLINELRLLWDRLLPTLHLSEAEELMLIAEIDGTLLRELADSINVEYETMKKRRQNLFKKIRNKLNQDDKLALEDYLKELNR